MNKSKQKQETAIFYNTDEKTNNNKIDKVLQKLDSIPETDKEFEKASSIKSMILDIMNVDENNSSQDFEELFEHGLSSYYNGDYTTAIEKFDSSLKILPNQSEAYYFKALSLGCLGKFNKAIKTIDKSLEISPTNSGYWNDKGAFLSELNMVSKAHRCFNKSIRLKPTSLNWSNKAALYHKCNNLEKAKECYENAMKYDEKDVYPVVGIAKIYMELEEFDNAEKYFEIAESIDNIDLEYLIERGKYMIFTKNYKQAIKYFDKCIHFNNNLAFVWMFKSMALKELNMEYDAEKCIEKAVELDSEILIKFNEFF